MNDWNKMRRKNELTVVVKDQLCRALYFTKKNLNCIFSMVESTGTQILCWSSLENEKYVSPSLGSG